VGGWRGGGPNHRRRESLVLYNHSILSISAPEVHTSAPCSPQFNPQKSTPQFPSFPLWFLPQGKLCGVELKVYILPQPHQWEEQTRGGEMKRKSEHTENTTSYPYKSQRSQLAESKCFSIQISALQLEESRCYSIQVSALTTSRIQTLLHTISALTTSRTKMLLHTNLSAHN
jgi:hypothetical protein